MLVAYILLQFIIFETTSTRSKISVMLGPTNPIGKVRGRIRFMFKNIPVEYELLSIMGNFISQINIEIYRYSHKSSSSFYVNRFHGHILHADINEAILYNLNEDFNDGELIFIFYSRAKSKKFQITSEKIRIIPEIEEFKVSKDMKRKLYPFKFIPPINPTEEYTIKLRKYKNDKNPINYISIIEYDEKETILATVRYFDGIIIYAGLKLIYDTKKYTLTEKDPLYFKRLPDINIKITRLYDNFLRIYSSDIICIEDFYENFKIIDRKVTWDILEKYRNKVSFDIFYYDGNHRKRYTQGIVCEQNKINCVVMKNNDDIFESGTLTSFTLKKCPPILKFIIYFYVKIDHLKTKGKTNRRLIEYEITNSDCRTKKEDIKQLPELDDDTKFKNIVAKLSSVSKYFDVHKNVPTINGYEFCIREAGDNFDDIHSTLSEDTSEESPYSIKDVENPPNNDENDSASNKNSINDKNMATENSNSKSDSHKKIPDISLDPVVDAVSNDKDLNELLDLMNKNKLKKIETDEFNSEEITDINKFIESGKDQTNTDVKLNEDINSDTDNSSDLPALMTNDKQQGIKNSQDVSPTDDKNVGLINDAEHTTPNDELLVPEKNVADMTNNDLTQTEKKITPQIGHLITQTSFPLVAVLATGLICLSAWVIYSRYRKRKFKESNNYY